MADNLDSPQVPTAETPIATPSSPQPEIMTSNSASTVSSGRSSPHQRGPRGGRGQHRQRGASPGAELAPPYSANELHALKVYDRHHSRSPPSCRRYARDARYEEINEAVVKRREDDVDRSLTKALRRHEHAVKVFWKARDNEWAARAECGRYSHLVTDYEKRMMDREIAETPEFRNRAEQELKLGLHFRYRPGSA